MRKIQCWVRVLVLGFLLFLLAPPIHTDAGHSLGKELIISADPEQEVHSAAAYNSQRQQYLVVWYNDRPGCDDIRARRVGRDGALIGNPFYISAGCPFERRYPDVAYDSIHDQYLVVWEQEEASSGFSIQARRVSGTGLVLDAADIPIRSPGINLYTPVQPAVAYASTSDRYLVVWSETWHPLPIQYEISGQVVTDAGALEGNRFPISQSGAPRKAPDLAYNHHANRYLVVWQEQAGTLWFIQGQQVHGGGGNFQSNITIAFYFIPSTAPAVASLPTSPTNDKFLVVWESLNAPNDRDINARLVAENGTLGTVFGISRVIGADETSPAIAATETGQSYFVTWRHSQGVVDKPIKGLPVSFNGTPMGSVSEFTGVDADYPCLAAGPSGDFLVVYQDQPPFATNKNLYGWLWGNRVYLPLVLGDR